jgi:hypothetical protein
MKLRPQKAVVEQCEQLRAQLTDALGRLPSEAPEVIDAVWAGEALGTLLWALQLAELPPYDTPFTADALGADLATANLRPADDIEAERETARLWHWRARTAGLDPRDLPQQYASVDQVVASAAMRGYERGVLPQPLRGDFRAFGKIYRHLSPEEHAEAHALAAERHHALNWLCGEGSTWEDVPLDT